MTNLDKWRLFLKDCPSPDSYIDMGFYSLINAALQRRVYLGSDDKPLFPNMFNIFVGPPAIGKGLVLEEVGKMLRFHKMRPRFAVAEKPKDPNAIDPEAAQALINEFNAANPSMASLNGATATTRPIAEPLAIPVAADAITYEALLRKHRLSLRTAHYNGTSKLLKGGMYSHSSLCFCLEEISSLFRKHTEDTVRYLIRAFDCTNYEYEAKGDGLSDNILSPCLNFLGGTQPSFIQDIFKDKLLTEGFASRCVFTVEDKPRFYRYDFFTYTPEQLQCKMEIIEHVGRLIQLFGLATKTSEAYEFMKHLVEQVFPDSSTRPNQSPKMDHYYGRKRVHIEKLALAIHFADSTDFTIPLQPFEQAYEMLNNLERRMDIALSVSGRNPLVGVHKKIVELLKRRGPMNRIAIWKEFVEDIVSEDELDKTLMYLTQIRAIEMDGGLVKLIGK